MRACVCLLAVLLLSAPAWAAAFQASQTACCEAGMCPLHGHAPKKSSKDGKAAQESPMATCDHHGQKSAVDCSLSCCHPAEEAVTAAVVFVLPGVAEISAPLFSGPALVNSPPRLSSFAFDPASPPPRASLLHQ